MVPATKGGRRGLAPSHPSVATYYISRGADPVLLRDATFTVFPPCVTPGCADDEPLGSLIETGPPAVQWQGVAATAGKHTMRVTATDYEPDIESTVYACIVDVTNPG